MKTLKKRVMESLFFSAFGLSSAENGTPGARHHGTEPSKGRMVFSRAYDRLDKSPLGKLADELRAAGVPNPRNAIIEDLATCPPDQRVVYEVEVEPEPELTHAEEAAHGVFEPLLQPAEAPGHSDIRAELEAEGVIPPLFSEADLAPSERPD